MPEVPPTPSSCLVPSSLHRSNWLARTLPLALACLTLAAGCNRPHQANVVATVNGHPIDQPTLERYYRNNLGNTPQQPSPIQSQIAHLEILRNLIDDDIKQQRAAKLNLVATDEEVDAKLAEIKAPFTQEEFKRQLAAKNMTLDDLKHDIRRGLTNEKLMNKEIFSKINITDADITAYFNANKSLFNLVEPEYHLAQIVVSAVPAQQPANMQAARANTDGEARKKIEALHTRLESGDDFGALASQFSEQASTASSGGDMGRLTESQLRQDSAVFAAISKLRPGQVTDTMPIYDQSHKVNGYAIYKLLDKEAAGQYELNDPRVQQTIRGQLRDSRAQLLRNAYDEMLRDQAHVENYYAEEIFKKGAQ
ncbi:MAG: SurA N-terminal domain-containing protein [Acidobacteriaceae bacterium]